MKPLLFILSVFLLAGCASQGLVSTAGRVVLPAPTIGRNPGWTPTEADLRALDQRLASLLASPDERVFGLGQTLPPYPLSSYIIRYTAAGPLDNQYIIGVAALPASVPADRFLAPTLPDAEAVALASAALNFQFIYNLTEQRIVEVRFNRPIARP